MKAIGGYFEIELRDGEEIHSNAIALNSGRNALYFILQEKKYKRIFVPLYTCDVVLEPLNKLGFAIEFYHIDQNFEPLFDFAQLSAEDAFLYTNYFGLKDSFINDLVSACKNVIIDNSQAYFSMPLPTTDTFYSPRKFLGLPDGGYAYTSSHQQLLSLETDDSVERCSHLLLRADRDAEEGYNAFQKNDHELSNLPLKRMSKLTKKLIQNANHKEIASKRRANFNYLKERLDPLNKISFKLNSDAVPMAYPFVSEFPQLQKKLAENRIYCAKYWPNTKLPVPEIGVEKMFLNQLIGLPIDQRYEITDMKSVVNAVRTFMLINPT